MLMHVCVLSHSQLSVSHLEKRESKNSLAISLLKLVGQTTVLMSGSESIGYCSL